MLIIAREMQNRITDHDIEERVIERQPVNGLNTESIWR
jgi:hypothetical protein